MNYKNEEKIFENVFEGVDGHMISNIGRRAMDKSDTEFLIYGEMPIGELIAIISVPDIADDIKKAKVFYDLGSGTGKVVVGAALVSPDLEKIFGIELVKTLYESSEQAKEKLSSFDKKAAERISFINDNFFNVDFSSPFPGDIIFMHYPIHGAEELYLRLEEKMKKELRSGAIIISCIRELRDVKTFPRIAVSRIKCSYSDVTVYYHRKV